MASHSKRDGEGPVLEPGLEETGGLGALTGRDDDEHVLHSAGSVARVTPRARTNLARDSLWGSYKNSRDGLG